MTYSIRIRDTRTGKQLGACDDLESPYAAGRTAANAYVVLMDDGHDPAHPALEGVVVEDDETRSFTPAEESAMVSALDQFMAEHGRKP